MRRVGTIQKKVTVIMLALVLVLVLCPFWVSASEPAEIWNRTFGGSGDDWGNSVQEASNGDYIIVGWTVNYGAGGADVWLIRADSRGNELWNRTYGGTGVDEGVSVLELIDGGYVILGNTLSYGAGGIDVWMIRADTQGNELWNKTFGGPESDIALSAKNTRDGGIVITGGTDYNETSGNFADLWLAKTDSKGNIEWSKSYGGSDDDWGHFVQETKDGGYIITGRTQSYGEGFNDLWLLKTDRNGGEEWNKTFGGPDNERGNSVQETEDGGFIVIGWVESFGAGGKDIWLVKTDPQGNETWNRTLGGLICDRGYSVEQTEDGGYILAGRTNSFSTGDCDLWHLKTDPEGNEIWNRTLGGPEDDGARVIHVTRYGGYILAGWTGSYGTGGKDVWLIKIG